MSLTSPATSSPRGALGVLLIILFALGAVIVAIAGIAVFFAFGIKMGHVDPHQPQRISVTFQLLGELAIYIPVGAYLLGFLPLLFRRSLRQLGLRAPGLREIGIGIVGAVMMTLAVDLTGALMVALTHRHDTEAAIAVLKAVKTPAEMYLFVSIAVVFAPMLEELGFRVFLYNAFTRFASVPVAVVLSGLVFGAVHSASLPQLETVAIPLAMGGIVLAIVYSWSRNYWSAVLTHALFNALPLTLFFVFHVAP